jgi:hypothetical protein
MEPRNYYIILRDRRVKALVKFDIPSEFEPTSPSTTGDDEPVCYVLMIAARLGIAIKIDDEDPARYTRVGHVCIFDNMEYSGKSISWREECQSRISIGSFPDAQSIMLV